MARKKTIHSLPPWKYNLILLTCLTRLRLQPSLPYPVLSSLLLHVWPQQIQKLALQKFPAIAAPLNNEKRELERWLVVYLEEICFKRSEQRASKIWRAATAWSGSAVRCLLMLLHGLWECDVRPVNEMWLQVRWRREGDWRADSLPDSPIVHNGIHGVIGQRPTRIPITDAEESREPELSMTAETKGSDDDLPSKILIEHFRHIRRAEEARLEESKSVACGSMGGLSTLVEG